MAQMTDEYRAQARAVSNAWRTEWESGCDYEVTGDEPEWGTTEIARALHHALDDLDTALLRLRQLHNDRSELFQRLQNKGSK